ncbi:T9SS type A sorting domain-containing protein [Fulvivirga ligni]|uniref:T9SS type A sorting domain-containing protein n=1 Tax=Fulvivirga ligni TaxID=2904246 RepID=UPI001F1E26E0|nr:T9SS type A sorting domain-containing protein [Fulvivirga ligni]UII19418.1 T9SS type A sorting domain-containing protein [Fulvivirga ligni]
MKNNATLFVQGNNTFNEFKAEKGVNLTLESGSVQTVNTLDLVGGKTTPVDINASTPGSQATISKSSGTVNASFLILEDINATGGATCNAQNSIDNGNNSGWNITPYNGLDYYWVGGNGIWDDVNHWAKTSGGNTFYTEPPGVLDNVFFNSASGGAGTTVTLTDENLAANLTFSSLATNFVVQGIGNELQVYGALVLDDALNLSAQVRMQSSETESVTFNDAQRLLGITFDGSGTFNLTDDITADNFFLYRGTLNTNNKVINALSKFFIMPETEDDRSDYIRFNGGTSSIYTSYFTTDQYWIYSQNITSDEVDLTETTIHLLENTSKSILGGGLVFNNIIFSSGTTNIYGSINGGIVAHTITVLPGTELKISPEEEDAVMFETLVAEGTENDPIEFRSLITGEQAYFKSTSGTAFEGMYLQIQDMNASGATFTAEESVDLGNNTGWNISSTKQNQTITFQNIPDKTFGDGDFELNVSASSGLEVLLTTASPNIEINGKTVTITGGGSATIRARQLGNDNYNAAAEVYKTFMVNKASQTISFDEIDDMDIEETTTINLNASASSDLPVTFSVVAGPASVEGNALTITGTGNITVRATQAGDNDYAAATFVDHTFEVTGNVTGIDALNTSFKLYPNPTQHQFVLENGGQDIKELYLVNANGGRRIIRSPKTKHITFGEDLAAGIWILEVHTAQGIYHRKLIKQ